MLERDGNIAPNLSAEPRERRARPRRRTGRSARHTVHRQCGGEDAEIRRTRMETKADLGAYDLSWRTWRRHSTSHRPSPVRLRGVAGSAAKPFRGARACQSAMDEAGGGMAPCRRRRDPQVRLTRALCIVLLLGVTARSTAAQRQPSAAISTAAWREDVAVLARELPRRHVNVSFLRPRAAFDRAIAQLQRDLPSLSGHQVVARLMEVAALPGDAHTALRPGRPVFGQLPVAFGWFSDGIVLGAASPHRRRGSACGGARRNGSRLVRGFHRRSGPGAGGRVALPASGRCATPVGTRSPPGREAQLTERQEDVSHAAKRGEHRYALAGSIAKREADVTTLRSP